MQDLENQELRPELLGNVGEFLPPGRSVWTTLIAASNHRNLASRALRKGIKICRNVQRLRLQKKVAFADDCPPARKDVSFSPHMLVCHQDILLAVCSAKALNLALGRALPWVFHDDGSLTANDTANVSKNFPGCRIVERKESDAFYESVKQQYPILSRLRSKHVMILKLADLYVYSEKSRILYMDSDVLFFGRPDFLVTKLEETESSNYFNKDIASAYINSPDAIKVLTGIEPPERINGGLSILNREDVSLDKIEDTLSRLDVRLLPEWNFYDHLIEQTTVAVLAARSRNGARHLPAEYDVALDKRVDTAACKHYVGAIRNLYELEGLRYLIREKGFLQRWKSFCNTMLEAKR